MKQNNDYYLAKLHNSYCFIPTRQAAADFRPVISTNKTGAFLWNSLKTHRSKEQLLSLVLEEYSTDGVPFESIKADIIAYLKILVQIGIIKEDEELVEKNSKKPDSKALEHKTLPKYNINIADTIISIHGDSAVLPQYVSDFSCSDCLDDERKGFQVYLIPHNPSADDYDNPKSSSGNNHIEVSDAFLSGDYGKTIIKKEEALIKESDTFYIIEYTDLVFTGPIYINKTTCETMILYKEPGNPADMVTLRHEIGLVIRVPFLLKVTGEGAMMLHSASVLYDNELVLFSAPSGTGKSTHAALWNKLFDAPSINGDTNLIKIEDNKAMVYGTPWCGTSQIYTAKCYPLKAVMFLKQAPADAAHPLTVQEASLKLFARLINPLWNHAHLDLLSKNVEALSLIIKCGFLECTKEDSAAVVCKDFIYGQ